MNYIKIYDIMTKIPFFCLLSFLAFVFSCQKIPELTLIGPSSFEIWADGGNETISFTANGQWQASCSESWISVSPSSGNAADGPVSISLSCSANATYDERNATVSISMDGLSQTVAVHQQANLGLIVPTKVYELQAGANTIEVEVQANIDYSISPSVSWIVHTGTKALSNRKLSFSIKENTSYDEREGRIILRPQVSGVQEQVISVRQAQKEGIVVEKTIYDMPYGGGAVEIKVQANVDFDVKINANWIHYVQTKSLSTSTICLNVDENSSDNSRSGKIDIKQKNGSISYTITINQAERVRVTGISLQENNLRMKVGESRQLTAEVLPSNAANKTVNWKSSIESIATVDNNGVVKGKGIGSATITATTADGGYKATCSISVVDASTIFVESVTLDEHSKTYNRTEGTTTFTLGAVLTPNYATNKDVNWTNSNSSIVSIQPNGLKCECTIYLSKTGTTNITVTTEDGGLTDVCIITVKDRDYVDLGLPSGRKWATTNIGGGNPRNDKGDRFAWAETETKTYFTLLKYKWYKNGKIVNPGGLLEISGTEYDVARVQWGGNWRMPTLNDWDELLRNCTINKYPIPNTVAEYWRVTGPNGKYIEFYHEENIYGEDSDTGIWSSTKESTEKAYYFSILRKTLVAADPYSGCMVRPVCD